MATQKISVSKEESVGKRFIQAAEVIIILLAVLALSIYVIISFGAENRSATVTEANLQRAFETDAARYTAMAAFYKAKDAADAERAIGAEAARYQGLAEIYAKPDVQRAFEAEAARYQAMADFYAENKANTGRINWDHPRRPNVGIEKTSTFLAANPELSAAYRSTFNK